VPKKARRQHVAHHAQHAAEHREAAHSANANRMTLRFSIVPISLRRFSGRRTQVRQRAVRAIGLAREAPPPPVPDHAMRPSVQSPAARFWPTRARSSSRPFRFFTNPSRFESRMKWVSTTNPGFPNTVATTGWRFFGRCPAAKPARRSRPAIPRRIPLQPRHQRADVLALLRKKRWSEFLFERRLRRRAQSFAARYFLNKAGVTRLTRLSVHCAKGWSPRPVPAAWTSPVRTWRRDIPS
jgi:hypothetical protein